MSEEHAGSLRYVAVWVALLGLTGLSFGLSYAPLGRWEVTVALLIAVTKATLVGLFFMHLIEQRLTTALVALVTVVWIALLCLGVASDVAFR